MITAAYAATMKENRMIWSKERSDNWWQETVNRTFQDKDWVENFRMSKATFTYICNTIKETIEKEDTNMRKACAVEKRVAIALWFLSTGNDYRTVGHLFGVSKSLVCLIVRQVCRAIVKVLMPKYIVFPKNDALKAVVVGFQHRLGFPQCAGVIDGSHIPIISPVDYPADYYNRKGWHLGHFIDINVGWPGRVHDARVFSNSSMYSKCQAGKLLPHWTKRINGKDIPLLPR